MIPSNFTSTIAWSWQVMFHNQGLPVHRVSHSVPASKCRLVITQSRPQVHLKCCLTMTSKFAWSRPPSASPNLLKYSLQAHLLVWSLSASKCLSKLTQSWPPSSVSNGSKFPGRFWFWFHLNLDRGNGSYHTKNPVHLKWAGCTTNNPALQHRNVAFI